MSTSPELAPPMNHVFVDFENVPEFDAAVIGTKAVSFTLLLGPKQTKLKTDLVEKMLAHASAVELIRLTESGRNAVDFALAYYLGRKVLSDPTGHFHIVSKDKGYEPLVKHLQSRHVRARLHASWATLTFTGPPKVIAAGVKAEAGDAGDSMDRVLEHLRKNGKNRPKTKKRLLSYLKSELGKEATDGEAAALLTKLEKAKRVVIGEKDAVTYNL